MEGLKLSLDRSKQGRFAPTNYVKGPPTQSYHDNLRDDVQYITTFLNAGWTNDVMTIANMIYLAQLTERVPILPMFTPSHLPKEAGMIPFGDVFDVPRLAKDLNMPILEWRDVKGQNSTTLDSMGCWSAWMASVDGNEPRESLTTDQLKLDVSYTSIPRSIKLNQDNNPHLAIQRLMALGFPSGRTNALDQNRPHPSPGRGDILEPSDHVLCFDFLYYLSVDRDYEWEYDWSPQWRFVGKHIHWAPAMEELAKRYVNRHFGLPENGPIPPFISAHIRRGDFKHACPEVNGGCLPSVKQLRRRVNEVKQGLAEKGIHTDLVLITSDERDQAWWEEERALGYTWIDHEALRTDEIHGLWYSPLLDAVFQSMGVGFVGTDGSTFSLIAERRVQDWHGGVAARLRWRGVPPEEL
ncbi:hypothetical protein CALVIDRAFT_549873 [Calocera viscosa TUFC12733]|uniref:GDP-fucose protein O-fucosyltransferase 2 n=1 Tax=Calocera viscosa (strain TUFC12733) TaxID=1330018 RepID=A0A167LHY4_CALVF|nr:hypothetical protein CALVIDRAFT_549873 [Calocera viscosa TUFC12733]